MMHEFMIENEAEKCKHQVSMLHAFGDRTTDVTAGSV